MTAREGAAPRVEGRRTTRLVYVVIALVFAGKFLGFLRLQQIALRFGSTAMADALLLAMNLFLVGDIIFISGSLVPVMLPRFIQARERRSDHAAMEEYARVARAALAVALVLGLALAFFIEPVAAVLAPGLDGEGVAYLARYSRILAPLPVVMAAMAFGTALNRIYPRGAVFAVNPVIINGASLAALLLGAMAAWPRARLSDGFLTAIVIATAVGAALQWAVVRSQARRRFARAAFGGRRAGSGRSRSGFVRAWLPLLGAVLVQHANVYVDMAFASIWGEGGVAILGYAERVSQVGVSIIVTSAFVVLEPMWAASMAREAAASMSRISRDIRSVLLLVAPVAATLVLAPDGVIRWIYGWGGALTQDATALVARTAGLYGLSILPLALSLAFARLLTIAGRTGALAVTNAALVAVNFVLDYLLLPRFGLEGIALATSAVAALQAALYYRALRRAGWHGAVGRTAEVARLALPLALCAIPPAIAGAMLGGGLVAAPVAFAGSALVLLASEGPSTFADLFGRSRRAES